MKQYLDIVRHVLTTGVRMPNRTGIDTLVTGYDPHPAIKFEVAV